LAAKGAHNETSCSWDDSSQLVVGFDYGPNSLLLYRGSNKSEDNNTVARILARRRGTSIVHCSLVTELSRTRTYNSQQSTVNKSSAKDGTDVSTSSVDGELPSPLPLPLQLYELALQKPGRFLFSTQSAFVALQNRVSSRYMPHGGWISSRTSTPRSSPSSASFPCTRVPFLLRISQASLSWTKFGRRKTLRLKEMDAVESLLLCLCRREKRMIGVLFKGICIQGEGIQITHLWRVEM